MKRKSHGVKLTDEEKKARFEYIRSGQAAGIKRANLAEALGISLPALESFVKKYRNEKDEHRKERVDQAPARITDDVKYTDGQRVRQRARKGYSASHISRQTGIPLDRVQGILKVCPVAERPTYRRDAA